MKHLKKFLSLILALCALTFTLSSCGDDEEVSTALDYCTYYTTRSTEGRDISYAKITVKDLGEIVVLLDATTAPITVANFKKLVSEGFYNGLTFHRIIENFMIQGGDPLANGTGGSDEEITGEFSSNGYANDIGHIRGVISMARSDNYNSASSQFFICNADSSHLDGDYAAFGYVVKGMSVVDTITSSRKDDANSSTGYVKKIRQPVIESIVILDSFAG